MFDLFRSRDKLVRIMLGGLLIVVALSMLTYLVPNYNNGASAGDASVVAEIGKEPVTAMEVRRVLQQQFRGRDIPPGAAPSIIAQTVEGLIDERAAAYQARRMGFDVTSTELADAIRAMIPSLFPDGKFVGKEAYAGLLSQQNVTIPEFEEALTRDILATRLRDIVMQGVIVTPAQVEEEFRRRNDKVKIEYVKIDPAQLRQQVQISTEEMQAQYKSNLSAYQMPEKRNLAILVLDRARLEQGLTPTDADLVRMYNADKDRFRVAERIKVRHILLKTSGNAPQDDAVKTKAENLLKQIKSGGNFADLAGKNSEDTASAKTGGELPDWVMRGQVVPEFEKVAFALAPGQISDLVKTQYGYHIIQLIAKEPAHLRTFAEVKNDLSTEWKNQRLNDVLQQSLDKAQAAIQKDPTHPEKVAADLNLQLFRADQYSAGANIPGIGANAELDASVASAKKGEVGQPVALGADKAAIAVVTEVFPPRPATFDEVQGAIREAITKRKAEKMLLDRSDELAKKVSANGGDLKQAAQSMGFQVKTSDDFDRQGAVEGLGPAVYVAEAFTKPAGSLVGPLSTPDGRLLVKVISHTPADLSKLAEQREAIRTELKQRMARERMVLFNAGLRDALLREGKIKIHQDVVNLIRTNWANYRG